MRCLDMLSHDATRVQLLIQAIRVRTLPTQVESALMHVAELDGSVTDLRVAAIHSRNPLHTFLFNSCGVLLNANASALQAFAHSHAGKSLPWFPDANHLESGDCGNLLSLHLYFCIGECMQQSACCAQGSEMHHATCRMVLSSS